MLFLTPMILVAIALYVMASVSHDDSNQDQPNILYITPQNEPERESSAPGTVFVTPPSAPSVQPVASVPSSNP